MDDVPCTQSSSCSSKRTRTVAVAAVSMARTVINSTHPPVSTHAVSDPAGQWPLHSHAHLHLGATSTLTKVESVCVQPLSFIRRALGARQTYSGSLLGDPRSTLVLPEPTKLVHPSSHCCLLSRQAARQCPSMQCGKIPDEHASSTSICTSTSCQTFAKRVKGQRGGMSLW
jgi:hypothetical protein